MTNLTLLQIFEAQAMNFGWPSIIEDLKNLTPENSKEERYRLHLLGKVEFSRGNITVAEDYFKQAVAQESHILIYCDLALCKILLSEFEKVPKAIQAIEEEFNKVREVLSIRTQVRVHYVLAKLNFEYLNISAALGALEDILEFQAKEIEFEGSDNFYLLARALRLGFKSFLNFPQAQLNQDYGTIELITTRLTHRKFEIIYSLLLADFRLRGISNSLLRFEEFLQTSLSSISEREKNLGYTGLAEIILLNAKEKPFEDLEEFKSNFLSLSLIGNYEVLLQQIVKVCETKDLVNDRQWVSKLLINSKSLSPMSHFKVLKILTILSSELSIKKEIEFRLNHIISNLGSKNSDLVLPLEKNIEIQITENLISKSAVFNEEKTTVIELKNNNQVIINGTLIALPKHKISEVLFSSFLRKTEIDHDEITMKTWEHNYEERHFQKIWTSVQRVNQALKSYVGIQKIFKISKNSVVLNDKIKIIDLMRIN